MASTNQISPEHEFLGVGKSLAYGLQHVLTMYGGIVAPPLIVGAAVGLTAAQIGMLITASLFVGGLATLLQTLGMLWFGAQLPLVQGVSFAGVASMIAIGTSGGGFPAILGAVFASAVIGLLIAPFFAKIVHFFPPVVTGSVITVIGLSLLPVALRWTMGGNDKAPNWGSLENIGLAGLTLLILLVLSKIGNEAIRRLAVLLSIVLGTVCAYVLGFYRFFQSGSRRLVCRAEFLGFWLPCI